ncbi:hypothetical protein AIIKEEIJ_05665 [Rhodococcus sp. YH1]|nr:hypothetical protein [Rhodococcus sp. YH1]
MHISGRTVVYRVIVPYPRPAAAVIRNIGPWRKNRRSMSGEDMLRLDTAQIASSAAPPTRKQIVSA